MLVSAAGYLTGAVHVLLAPVVTTTSIILSSNKIQDGDILVYPGYPGKWPLKECCSSSFCC